MAIKLFGAGPRTLCAPAGLLAFTLAMTSASHAAVIDITANTEHRLNGFGLFEGAVEYQSTTDDGSGILLVTLTNLLPESSRGHITGFLFNIGSEDPFAKATLIESPPVFRDATHQNAPPFGHSYDAGAALKGHFMGGGNPRKGIAPGETSAFMFLVTASDARTLTPESFLDGPFSHNFVVRFRGTNGSGVDIVPAMTLSIPGPSALAAVAVVIVLSGWRRRTSARDTCAPSNALVSLQS